MGPYARQLDASVIVTAYRQAATLSLAIHALTRQDFTGKWEIIVCDDGSDDETAAVVTGHTERVRVPTLYVRQPHIGRRWATSRNNGIRLARGSVLLFLDADMVPARDVLRLHVQEQREHPALLAGPRLWRHHQADLASVPTVDAQLEHLEASTGSHDDGYRHYEAAEIRMRQELLASPHPWRAWFGCHASMPAIPGALHDEAMLGWGPVDIELACRLHQAGTLPVRYLSQARAWHVERPEAVYNPFRLMDRQAATDYVHQVCHMIAKYPHLDLAKVLTMGWDRLVLDPDGLWRTVPRGQGRPAAETLELAMARYHRVHRRELG